MELDEYLTRVFDPALEYYTQVLHRVEELFPKPALVELNGITQWRYPKLTVAHMCLLRVVRIISGFNAIRALLAAGHVQEIWVLMRTIDEFHEDIIFLTENYPTDDLSPQQEKFMIEMGKEEYLDMNHPFGTQVTREPPIRRKVKASVARFMEPVVNPSDSQKMSHLETDMFSGYVHGAYPHVMELYGGPPPGSCFHLAGMSGTPRTPPSMKFVAMYLQRTGPVLAFMCHAFGMSEEVGNLAHMKEWFLKELGDNFGLKTDYTSDEILKEIKRGKRPKPSTATK